MSKVGVVFSGCGFYDGSEIQEAVLTLLTLDRNGATAVCMAPNIEQHHVINHLTGNPVENTKRNVLEESARITRGKIQDIKNISASDFDALIFPGGFGAAKNLSNFAFTGANCVVNSDVERLLKETFQAKKPIAMVCITPAIASKVFLRMGKKVKLTIGSDKDTADALEAMGTEHVSCPVTEFIIDEENKIISSPAYMYGESRIADVAEGIEKTVKELLKLI